MLSRLKNRFVSFNGTVSALLDSSIEVLPVAADGDILLVPAEQVLTFAVPLPLPSHRKRVEALPFAIEDRIAQPTESVHIALAPMSVGGLYLASVVDPALMAAWVDRADAAGLGTASIMPDALALPLPLAGRWTVMRQPGDRVLVRLDDGRGFAANEPNFILLWNAAGKPECDEVRHYAEHVERAIDLRQGAYAVERSASVPFRRLAAVVAIGLLAHGAIAGADIVLLKSVAARRGIELQSQLAASAPGAYPGMNAADAALIAERMLPAGETSPPGPLIPTLATASRALAPMQGALAFRGISYEEAGDRLRFDIDAADTATLGRARQALVGAGLPARIEGSTIIVDGGGIAP